MKLFRDRYNISFYYFLISILYFTSTQHTWVFRKVFQLKGFIFGFYPLKYILTSFFVLFTIYVFNKINIEKFGKNILGVILLFDFIPSSIFFSSVQNIDWRIYACHILLFYSLLFSLTITFVIRVNVLKKKQTMFLLVAITFVAILPYLRYLPHINIKNLLLEDIYTTRLKFRSLFDTYSGYTHSWLTRVVIPIIFIFTLKYKMKLLTLINSMFLIFLYLMGAVKSVLLGSILVVLFYIISNKNMISIITKGLNVLLLLALIYSFFVINDRNIINVIIFRRIMFLPSLLDYCYFDFFNDNYLYWSNSFLKGVVEYPYLDSVPRLIGLEYFDKDKMAANNGLISDGFSNAGFIGVLFSLFIFNFFMVIVKNCNVDSKFFGIYFFILYGFLTTATSTVLITHGGILLLLITFLLLREPNKSYA